MNPVALPVAIHFGDLAGIAAVIVIIFASAVWQWLVRSVQLERRMQQPGRPGPPADRPRDRTVDDEIGEFLRRAAQRRGPQAAPPLQGAPLRRAAEQPVQAEIVEENAAAVEKPVGRQVTQHVEAYLDSGEFARRSSELGGEVAQADAQLGEHLRQAFDHEVGKLAEKPGEAAAPPAVDESLLPAGDRLPSGPSPAAVELAALLGDIDGIRQAVVLNEILRRPEDRWA
jgi:hypothetical protein